MNRSEHERRILKNGRCPLAHHSMNQQNLKIGFDRQQADRASKKQQRSLRYQSRMESYEEQKAQRVIERVKKVLAGYDGVELSQLVKEIRYLDSLGFVRNIMSESVKKQRLPGYGIPEGL